MKVVKPNFCVIVPEVPFILSTIEDAGRLCYKSKPSDSEEEQYSFIRKRIKAGHESIIEHSLVSVCITCDRGVSHELVRHRLCAFSQESTRYCDYKDKDIEFIKPFWMEDLDKYDYDSYDNEGSSFYNMPYPYQLWCSCMSEAEKSYKELRKAGWTPQQARSVLPNSLKTELIMSANLREWRHIFKLRTDVKAHPQMREIMVPLCVKMRKLFPPIFDDILKEYENEIDLG